MGFTTLFYHLKRASPAEAFLFLRLDQIQPSQQPGGAADLIAFGAYTGCRIEELAQLTEVHFIDGAFKVEDSKSAAGIREVPLHPALIGMVNRLTEKAGAGYLLEGSDEGSFGKRSDAMGKRFGKLKTALGFGPQHVFHSIRKTVVSQLEQAGSTRTPPPPLSATISRALPMVSTPLEPASSRKRKHWKKLRMAELWRHQRS